MSISQIQTCRQNRSLKCKSFIFNLADTALPRSLVGVNFTGADLSTCDLSGFGLSGCNRHNANLSNDAILPQSLVGVNFAGADLFWSGISQIETLQIPRLTSVISLLWSRRTCHS